MILAGRGGDRLVPGRPPCAVRWTAVGKDRQPPNAVRSEFVPASAKEVPDPDRSGRRGRGAPEVTLPPWRLPWVLIRPSSGPYLASALNDERWRSVDIELIAAGMSNLTYVVTPDGGSADDAVILRRPPTGAVLATAHDMAREHRVISALGPTAVPVPRTLHLCTDDRRCSARPST